MASNFSANQYENAFRSRKLQNWTIPKQFKERPVAAEGHTTFIANDHGHLLPGVKRETQYTFVGTWDLPRHVAPTFINPTARSLEGQERLRCWSKGQGQRYKGSSFGKIPQETLKSAENVIKDTLTNPPEGELCETLTQHETSPTSPRPASQPRASSQPRSASVNQQEEIQPPVSEELFPETEQRET